MNTENMEYDVTTHIIVIGDRRWSVTIKDAFNKVDPYIVVWSGVRGQANQFQGFWKVKKLKANPNKQSVLESAKLDSLI
jgi:hypothetical protein